VSKPGKISDVKRNQVKTVCKPEPEYEENSAVDSMIAKGQKNKSKVKGK
jgi:hypothetical protein